MHEWKCNVAANFSRVNANIRIRRHPRFRNYSRRLKRSPINLACSRKITEPAEKAAVYGAITSTSQREINAQMTNETSALRSRVLNNRETLCSLLRMHVQKASDLVKVTIMS